MSKGTRKGGKLTICMAAPRPAPVTIWYPIHLAVSVEGVRVDSNPLPMEFKIPPKTAKGK